MLLSSSSDQPQPTPAADSSETDISSTSHLSQRLTSIFKTQSGLMASADGVRALMQNFEDEKFMAMLLQSPTTTMTLLECLVHREFEGSDRNIGRTAVREFLTTPLAVWEIFGNLSYDKNVRDDVANRLFAVLEELDCHSVTAILGAPHVAKSLAFFHQGEKLDQLPANCLERLSRCEEFATVAKDYGFLASSSPSIG